MSDAPPLLSVIVAATGRFHDLPRCLSTIADQSAGRRVEMILAYGSENEAPAAALEGADVRPVRVHGDAALPRLLGAALAEARGEIIAVTDASCRIHDHWVSSILEAHEGAKGVVGGAVEPEGLHTLVDWTAYFCDYGQFMLPLVSGAAREMPGNNISMKRWMLSNGRRFVDGEFWKTYWCWAVQGAGHELFSTPSIVVSYRKRFRLGAYLIHRFHNGRCFAGMRNDQIGRAKRLIYLIGSLALPAISFWRTVRTVAGKRRYRARLVLCFPLILVAAISWAAGEFFGYLGGAGGSCRHVR